MCTKQTNTSRNEDEFKAEFCLSDEMFAIGPFDDFATKTSNCKEVFTDMDHIRHKKLSKRIEHDFPKSKKKQLNNNEQKLKHIGCYRDYLEQCSIQIAKKIAENHLHVILKQVITSNKKQNYSVPTSNCDLKENSSSFQFIKYLNGFTFDAVNYLNEANLNEKDEKKDEKCDDNWIIVSLRFSLDYTEFVTQDEELFKSKLRSELAKLLSLQLSDVSMIGHKNGSIYAGIKLSIACCGSLVVLFCV